MTIVTSKAKIPKVNILNSLIDLVTCGSENGHKKTRVSRRLDYVLTNC